MQIYSTPVEEAARFWHQAIGRFLGSAGWAESIGSSYPCFKVNGAPIAMRLGGCKASFVMIDAKSAILVDKLNIARLPGVADPQCQFLYGEHVKGVTNLQKTQINWALDEARAYPLLLVRMGNKNPMTCLHLSHTDDLVTVCIPTGSYSFEPKKVRSARDFIIEHALQKAWRKAADLRQTIGLNDHVGSGVFRENKLLEEHEQMLKLFPLHVWLPAPGTGEHIALGESLAEKVELDLAALSSAREVFFNSQPAQAFQSTQGDA